MEYLGDDDLEYKEERELDVKPTVVIKKNIPLKIKSINLSSSTTQSSNSVPAKQPAATSLVASTNVVNVNVIDHTITSRETGDSTATRNSFTSNIININSTNLNPPMAKIKKTEPIDESEIFSPTTSNCSISPGKSSNSNLTHEKITENRKNHLVNNLNWNLNVNVISQKISDQRMDYCMLCCLPILVYARFIPCKHVTCIQCATNNGLNICLKDGCITKVERIEKISRGNIFVCTYESNEHETNADALRLQPEMSQKNHCGRSYLSQRDLEAHIKHRHEPTIYQPNATT